ncbi:MAG: hypothetical protein ACI8W3_002252 [Myxococcota bacterium]|jgi:hypothetical protein
MPITRFLVVALMSGFCAWGGWTLASPSGILPGFLLANLGMAVGWYFGRSFVRNNLD